MASLRISALLLVSLLGCSDGSVVPGELVSAREQFKNTLQGSYKFTWQSACLCPAETAGPFRITVQTGQIIQALDATELPVSNVVKSTLMTIEGVFDTIEDAYNEGAASITVTYDANGHFPASVNLDYDADAADEEFVLRISDVVPFEAS
jgi:hypothetical protein